jgi:hypothetical protein
LSVGVECCAKKTAAYNNDVASSNQKGTFETLINTTNTTTWTK